MEKADKIISYTAIAYIVFPIMIFLFGWTRPVIAILISMVLLYLGYRLGREMTCETEISITVNRKFWLVALGVIALWVLFSGIGDFSFQTGDFIIRNPMFHDLKYYRWPVIYDLSKEPQLVKKFTGNAQNALYVYYFTWWLPASLFARILNFLGTSVTRIEVYTNIALYMWTVIGLFLTFYFMVRYLKRYSYWILSSLILFGGFDFVVYLISNMRMPLNEHIEWWAGGPCMYFQYSANTTQLYWVFNQSVPIWLVVAVLLVAENPKQKLGWASLSIAYSPYATIGIIPIAIYATLKSKVNLNDSSLRSIYHLNRVKNAVSIENTVVPLLLAFTYVSFFALKLNAGTSRGGFIFSVYPEFRTFTLYIAFIVVEFFIYFLVMGKKGITYEFYWVTLIELIVIPLFRAGMNNDFTMRTSIPALFILMFLCLRFLLDSKTEGHIKQYKTTAICLCIGYLVSCTEIQRNMNMTLMLPQRDYIYRDVYSFGTMYTENENQIMINLNQYMSLDDQYKDSFFYKYIMKK